MLCPVYRQIQNKQSRSFQVQLFDQILCIKVCLPINLHLYRLQLYLDSHCRLFSNLLSTRQMLEFLEGYSMLNRAIFGCWYKCILIWRILPLAESLSFKISHLPLKLHFLGNCTFVIKSLSLKGFIFLIRCINNQQSYFRTQSFFI